MSDQIENGSKPKKGWDHYASSGGVGLGMLSVFLANKFGTDFTKELIAFLAPTLSYLSAFMFNHWSYTFRQNRGKKFLEKAITHQDEIINDPLSSPQEIDRAEKRKAELLKIKSDNFVRNIQRFMD